MVIAPAQRSSHRLGWPTDLASMQYDKGLAASVPGIGSPRRGYPHQVERMDGIFLHDRARQQLPNHHAPDRPRDAAVLALDDLAHSLLSIVGRPERQAVRVAAVGRHGGAPTGAAR